MKILEGKKLKLECSLSMPDVPVKWLKDGEEISPSSTIKPVTSGKTQQLVFTEVTLQDQGQYTCVAGDVSTEATLTVEGQYRTYLWS